MNKSVKKKKQSSKELEGLPNKPHLTILKQSDEELENEDYTRTDYQLNIDAIAGLAFIENVKSGQTDDEWNKEGWNQKEGKNSQENKKRPHLEIVPNNPEQSVGPKYNFKAIFYIMIICGSLYGSYQLINSSDPEKTTLAEVDSEKKEVVTKRIRPVKKQRPKINNRNKRDRNIRRAPAATSFRESEVFKKHKVRKLEDSPLREEESYNDEYDDGNDSIENDPMRSDTAKEIINPDEDYFDQEEKELFDEEDGSFGEREPSSQDEDTWVDAAAEDGFEGEYADEYDEGNLDDMEFEDAEQF